MHLYVWCHVILKWIGHKTSAHTDIQYIIILQVLAKYCLYTFCMHILYICFMYWYISCYKCTVAPSSMICPTTPHLRKISFLAKLHLSPTSESLPLFFFNFPYPLHWFAPPHWDFLILMTLTYIRFVICNIKTVDCHRTVHTSHNCISTLLTWTLSKQNLCFHR